MTNKSLFAVIALLISVSVCTAQGQSIASQIIAREKASFEAWQKKDKAFFVDYLADDATFLGPRSPYMQMDPRVNFLPKFEQYVDMFKIIDFQMHNPQVQVYGNTAVLTYYEEVMADMGGKTMSYTGKVSAVYVKQGNSWRVVHAHESLNPGAQ